MKEKELKRIADYLIQSEDTGGIYATLKQVYHAGFTAGLYQTNKVFEIARGK